MTLTQNTVGTSAWRAARILVAAAAMLPLAGCGLPISTRHRITLKEAPPPQQSLPSEDIVKALTCIRDSHVLNKIRFGIAVHSDGTGKTSYGYEGATGSFLPQGTAAIWAAESVIRAGGLAMNYYELNTERALRQFGGPGLEQSLAQAQQTRAPNFIISTAFTALDFIGGPSMDMRVGGVGPYYDVRGASLEVSAEMYRPGDRMTMAISSLNRQIYYRSGGLGIARIMGGGNGTLVTGTLGFNDQQRLQEATRDVVALSVADVLAAMPIVPDNCRSMVDALKGYHRAVNQQEAEQFEREKGKKAPKQGARMPTPAPLMPVPAAPPAALPETAPRGALQGQNGQTQAPAASAPTVGSNEVKPR
ncbi:MULTISPECIES: hypothetical protein [Novosphingobium]|uniref:hypothetical protein n=1 Tax=Novosphingobium TaxID=165696 RepID=UPI001CD3F13D|nr:hypothetical protein [Novosphingobium percolationis]MCH7629344.1 hypothetical protein [Pseudomonadota bacterium]